MQVTDIAYFDGAHELVGKLFCASEEQKKQPAIILFHAFEGIGEFTQNYAKKMAEQGYIVFAADMYGHGESADNLDDCYRLLGPFLKNNELARHRAILAFEALLKQKNVDPDRIGAMGFCFGGRCMLELARSGAVFRAGVSAHGDFSPSTLPVHSIKPSLLILHGYEDRLVPSTRLPAFAEEMKQAQVDDWSIVFFGHAEHSYTDPATGTYDPEREREMGRAYDPVAARRTFTYAMDFFEEKLG